jgi:hypoxia up-regulated 1
LPKYNASRSGLTLTVDGVAFTPEELVAMVLSHAVDISVAYAVEGGNTILPPRDMVLTVPSYTTMPERQALYDAAALAELNVLTLLDENTAAALHYAMDKSFEKDNEQLLLFYNMGASALQVSVIRFYNYLQPQKYGAPKSVPALEVLGKSWDATCGGDALDHILVEYLADQFNLAWHAAYPQKKDDDVRNHTRAMTKLRLQANKIKHVLSANVEIPVHMDAVHDEVALQTHISRAQLEQLAEPLIQRAIRPIAVALQVANKTMADLTGIELIGGGMRIPKIQQEIQKLLPDGMELGMHINSDESFALGAAFAGANLSTAFRVRPVGLTDISPFAMAVSLTNLEENAASEWSKTATLFKSFGKVGVKKTIAFTHDQDILCGLDYLADDPLLPPGTELALVRYNITGVPEFALEMQNITGGTVKPKISLQFELSPSGVASLVKAEAAVEEIYTVQEEVEVDSNSTVTTNATTDGNATSAVANITDVVDDVSNNSSDAKNDTNATAGKNATEKVVKPKVLVEKVSCVECGRVWRCGVV